MGKVMDPLEFVRRAKEVHGDAYDYSGAVYRNMKAKVRIRCPEHGVFEQAPEKHLKGRGCPECGKARSKATNLERYGVEHPLQSADIRRQICRNNLSKYGTEHPQSLDFVRERIRSTNRERYGVDNPMFHEGIKAHHHDVVRARYGGSSPFCDPAVHAKADSTRLERYGNICPFGSDVIRDRSKRTCLERYGTEYALQSDSVRQRARQTCLERHGTEYPLQSPGILARTRETLFENYRVDNPMRSDACVGRNVDAKRRNGMFSSSACEDRLYADLVFRFGRDGVLRQYRSVAYPFACDFYVVSLDLYVELNAHWTHGFHWFDPTDEDDLDRVERWKRSGGTFYGSAVRVWTGADVRKRRCAADSDLNYAVFWRVDLGDARDWMEQGCPVRKDWM